MKSSSYRRALRRLVATACLSAPIAASAAPLYQWSFDTGFEGVPSVTAGGGTFVPNGTANFLGAGASGNAGDFALNLTNAYTGGVGAGNSVVAGGANVLTGLGTLSNFTVTMWVKVTAGDLTNFPRLLQLGTTSTPDSGSNPGINMLLNNGALEVGVNGNNAQVSAGISPGVWKFIAFSYDGGNPPNESPTNFDLYNRANNAVVLTGSLTNSVSVVGGAGLNTSGSSPGSLALGTAATLYLGDRANGQRGFTGQIDDVRIYNTQLTIEELEAIRLESAPPPPSGGVPYYWKGNVSSAWNAGNWTSDSAGATPAALPADGGAAATFVADGASNFTNTLLGAAQDVKSIVFNSQATGVEIGGTHALTIGSGGVTVSAAAGPVGITTTGGVALGANQTWTNNSASALTVSAPVGGAFVLTTAGTGETVLSGANTHAGTATQGGTLTLGNALALGAAGASLNVEGGTVNLNGFSPQIGSLAGTTLGTIINRAEGTTSTVLVNTAAGVTDTFSGHFTNGSATQRVALTKTGSGTLALSSTSNFTGDVLVSGGTLAANVSLFIAPTVSSLGNAQTPGRTITVQNGATLLFGNHRVLGNGQGDLAALPRLIVEAGGTVSSSAYNVIGGVTLRGGTLAQNIAGASGSVGYAFGDTIVAEGGVTSLISNASTGINHLGANTTIEVAADSGLTISAPLGNQSADFLEAPGGFTKTGPGTLTLGTGNTYTGATTLSQGKLVLTSATSLSDTAAFAVTDSASATLELNFTGTEVVSDFLVDGASPGPGTYGPIGSGATHTYSWITGTGRISIGALPSTTPLEDWRQTWFGTTEATDDAANDADPDADGVANLLEYALGGNPTEAETDLLPVATRVDGHLTLSFLRIADGSLTYSVEASGNLADWNSVWSSSGDENVEEIVSVPDPEALSAHARRFLRLRVTETAP